MRITSPNLRTRCLAAVLVLALLLAQALGFVHRTVHGHLPAGDSASVAAAEHAPGGPTDATHGPWVPVFDHDDGGAECRLFDAVGHDAVHPCPVALPAFLPPAAILAVLAGESLARWATMFDARGPPPAR